MKKLNWFNLILALIAVIIVVWLSGNEGIMP